MKQVSIIMGFPCSGKSTIVKDYINNGWTRLNRDDHGGSIDDLHAKLDVEMAKGTEKLVLDNTYGTVEKREEITRLAKKHCYRSVCVWLASTAEDAQFNSASRILTKFHNVGNCFGSPEPYEMLGPDIGGIKDSDAIPVIALFAYKKKFEKPTKDEGWDEISKFKFERKWNEIDPFVNYSRKAVIFDYDDTLRKTKSGDKFPCNPDDIEILPNRIEKLKELDKQGLLMLGCSNQSGIEKGTLSMETAIACFDRTNELLGFDIDVKFCPHHSFPIRCYCRKPLAGIAAYFCHKYELYLPDCIMVGDQTSDKTFAKRAGMQFVHANEFFK